MALAPMERSRAGKLSPAYTQTRAPKPKVNPTVNSSRPRKPSAVSAPPKSLPSENVTTSTTLASIMIPMPMSRIGRRPIRSTSASEQNTASRPATWTSAGRPRVAALPVKPIASKIRGL